MSYLYHNDRQVFVAYRIKNAVITLTDSVLVSPDSLSQPCCLGSSERDWIFLAIRCRSYFGSASASFTAEGLMKILYSAPLLQNVLEKQAWLLAPFFKSCQVLCIFR